MKNLCLVTIIVFSVLSSFASDNIPSNNDKLLSNCLEYGGFDLWDSNILVEYLEDNIVNNRTAKTKLAEETNDLSEKYRAITDSVKKKHHKIFRNNGYAIHIWKQAIGQANILRISTLDIMSILTSGELSSLSDDEVSKKMAIQMEELGNAQRKFMDEKRAEETQYLNDNDKNPNLKDDNTAASNYLLDIISPEIAKEFCPILISTVRKEQPSHISDSDTEPLSDETSSAQ